MIRRSYPSLKAKCRESDVRYSLPGLPLAAEECLVDFLNHSFDFCPGQSVSELYWPSLLVVQKHHRHLICLTLGHRYMLPVQRLLQDHFEEMQRIEQENEEQVEPPLPLCKAEMTLTLNSDPDGSRSVHALHGGYTLSRAQQNMPAIATALALDERVSAVAQGSRMAKLR